MSMIPDPIPVPDPDAPRLFEVPAIRDEAIARAGDHADTAWRATAEIIVRTLARSGRDFTADDVWAELENRNVSTHEPRALGAIITGMARAGVIERVGYQPTRRPSAHMRPIAVWRVVGPKPLIEVLIDDPRDDGDGDPHWDGKPR